MQTNNIQLPNLSANAVAAPKVNLNLSAGGDNNAFKQALSREMEQRQAGNSTSSNQPSKAAERPNASRASAPKQQAAPAKQPQNDDDAPAPQASSNDPAAAPAPVPARTASSSDSDSSSADSDNSDAQAAQAADPVADMLALVAAFNQPAAPAATPLPAADAGSA
ncbi:flagellar hook-length control protein FliK, partial [Pseudoduganella sp. FT9W]|nr:flagellar hook-length control protein FliK [Duganella alba]